MGLPSGGPLAEMLGVAHDGMRVPLALLPWLPGLAPAVTAALDAEVYPDGGEGAGDVLVCSGA